MSFGERNKEIKDILINRENKATTDSVEDEFGDFFLLWSGFLLKKLMALPVSVYWLEKTLFKVFYDMST